MPVTRTREEGSLVIALAVVIVLSGLAAAITTRTLSALGNARLSQDQSSATAAADAGLTDALFALEQWTPPAVAPTTGSGTTASGTYAWTVTTTDGLHATVSSVGTVNGRQHRIDATASRPPAWPWLVATRWSLVLDGPGTVGPAGAGRLASGGALVLRGGAPRGAGQDLLGPGASCTGCGAPGVVGGPAPADAEVPTSPPPLPCPADPGTGTVSELTAGTYECDGSLTFSTAAPVTVAGPVVIYLVAGGGGATLDLAGSVVNEGGDPTQLVIHVVGPGVVQPGDSTGSARYTGVIDAPESILRSDACDLAVTGALVLGSLACTAPPDGPGPSFTADTRVAALPGGPWWAGGYHDVPVAG